MHGTNDTITDFLQKHFAQLNCTREEQDQTGVGQERWTSMGYGGMLLVSLSSRDASFHPTGRARATGTWSKAGHGSEYGLCRIRLPATVPTMGRCLPIPQGTRPHPEWEGSQNPKYSLDYTHRCLNLCVQGQLH